MKEILGSHVSFSKEKQLLGSVLEALSYGSTTFMFYTGAPQNTNRIPIDSELTLSAHNLMKEEHINIEDVVVHAPYIINLANPKNMDFNVRFLKEEIKRVEQLGVSRLVLHPGSHVGLGLEVGISNIVEALNLVLEENSSVMICLETMAGKGSEVGSKLEELKAILDGLKDSSKVGVCIDTCHLNDAGYSLEDFDSFLEKFDRLIGLSKLQVVHVNDSKNILGSHKDRHENIGCGTLGFSLLHNIVSHPKLKGIPKILETPYIDSEKAKYPPYAFEIEMLQKGEFRPHLKEDVISYYKDHKNKEYDGKC